MSYKHCDPCNHFDICICCEQEMCLTCRENINSQHINLTKGGQEKLDRLRKEDMLMPGDLCRECEFYAHHNINDPEQEHYNENLIYEVKEYQDGLKEKGFGMKKVPNWKTRIITIGPKPKPQFPYIWGPFEIHPIKE